MKYIRTKYGIYEVEKKERAYFEGQPWLYYCKGKYDLVEEKDIIKQADTIEELCDGFVVISEEYEEPHYVKKFIDTNALDFENNWKPYGNGKVLDQSCQKLIDAIIYGAIWTDKGLIYVAKMNEKGELELL